MGFQWKHCLSLVQQRLLLPGLAPATFSLAWHSSTTTASAEALGTPGQAPSSLPILDWHRGVTAVHEQWPEPFRLAGSPAPTRRPTTLAERLGWGGPARGPRGCSRTSERWPLTNGRLQPNGDPSEAANDLAALSTPPSPTPRSWTIGAGGMGGVCAALAT